MSPDSEAGVVTEVRANRLGELELVDTPPLDEPGRIRVGPDRSQERGVGRGLRGVWAAFWPKLLAVALVVLAWQVVVWSGWKPTYLLPGPVAVFRELAREASTPEFWQGILWTMRRGVVGFAVAVLVGTVLGIAIARIPVLRTAIGSMITGLQTMPSIAWFPLAILLFKISETAILFVILLGAVPSIANGILAGIDHVPPQFVRLGHVLGARGLTLYRHVVIPAALPSYVAGLGQGWAFAWRSLMAGELLVIIEGRPSLGQFLQFSLEFVNAKRMLAVMIVILVLGMLVDAVFSAISRRLRSRRGLLLEKRAR